MVHLRRAVGGLRDALGDFLCRGALFVDRRANGSRDLVDFADAFADRADGGDRLIGGCLAGADLSGDVIGRARRLRRP